MLTYPEIDPIIFALGPLKIRWYGLMYVIAFLLAWWLARRRSRRNDSPVNSEQVDDLLFYGMLGVIIGGRVGYAVVYGWDQFTSDPLYLFKITQGGMSFHGGLAGVMPFCLAEFGSRRCGQQRSAKAVRLAADGPADQFSAGRDVTPLVAATKLQLAFMLGVQVLKVVGL